MYIYGKNIVKEAIDTNQNIVKAYISKKNKNSELTKELQDKKIKTQLVDEVVLNRLVKGLHQGYVLKIEEVATYPIEELYSYQKKELPLVVVLDHLEDPHNFGAIIRTSEAMGVKGIIIPNDRSVSITGTVVKTSAGAIHHTKIIRVPNINNAIHKLKENGYWIVGTDMSGEDYQTIDYKVPIALVIGNEGHGISKIVRESCDYIAKIPMYGKINSLNASVSCGIFLVEIVNARR